MYRGAEAVISEKDNAIIKERVKKSYRLPQIDEKLRKLRTRSEASLIREAARAGVFVPRLLEENGFSLVLEKINGQRVKEALDENNMEEICRLVGASVAKLHSFDIIHGDLTTSNMIIKGSNQEEPTPKASKLFFIDFGLGFRSPKPEDKATDLHVLREALESTHFSIAASAWKIVLKTYKESYKDSDKVIKSLQSIEKRGRYRDRSG